MLSAVICIERPSATSGCAKRPNGSGGASSTIEIAGSLDCDPGNTHRRYAKRVEDYHAHRAKHPDGPPLVPAA